MTTRTERYIERINNENNRLHEEKTKLENENLVLQLRVHEEWKAATESQKMLIDISSYFFVFVLIISSQIWCLNFWDGENIRSDSIAIASLCLSMLVMTVCMVVSSMYDLTTLRKIK